jgi:hypothetical protein
LPRKQVGETEDFREHFILAFIPHPVGSYLAKVCVKQKLSYKESKTNTVSQLRETGI